MLNCVEHEKGFITSGPGLSVSILGVNTLESLFET